MFMACKPKTMFYKLVTENCCSLKHLYCMILLQARDNVSSICSQNKSKSRVVRHSAFTLFETKDNSVEYRDIHIVGPIVNRIAAEAPRLRCLCCHMSSFSATSFAASHRARANSASSELTAMRTAERTALGQMCSA